MAKEPKCLLADPIVVRPYFPAGTEEGQLAGTESLPQAAGCGLPWQ
jgi:hypothetical protein